jgi:hypothetical protein
MARARTTLVLAAAAALPLGAAACSNDARDELFNDAAELAVRNFAAWQGAEHLDAAGYDIDGRLSCTAMVGDDGVEAVEITCTGTTADGGEARLTGVTSELPGASITELKGEFTATVDGVQVFTTDQLGG